MGNCTQNTDKSQAKTWIKIAFKEDITADLGNVIPYPQNYEISGKDFIYWWLLDGFFWTNNNINYLNDIIARFKITYPDCRHLETKWTDTENNINPIKLKQFQGLKSKANDIISNYQIKRAETYQHKDSTFWCLKLYAEALIREDGMIIYQRLEKFALENFSNHKKGWSTVRMKIASIYKWYEERDWQIGREKSKYKDLKHYQEETMATRVQHAKNMAQKKVDENISKIKNAITGLMADSMFKKKNGTWNGKAIADYLSIDPRTVNKYLKALIVFQSLLIL